MLGLLLSTLLLGIPPQGPTAASPGASAAVAVRGEAELTPAAAFTSAQVRVDEHVRAMWRERADRAVHLQRPLWIPELLSDEAVRRWLADLPVSQMGSCAGREGRYRKPGYVPGFEIVNKLGGGMFGLVFKARKESIGKDYAVKFLKVDDDTVRDAVVRELDNVSYFAQIDHPNLVSIEDRGTVDGIPYLVMSYAGQETLQKRLSGGRLSRDDALRIFVQAARGVQALHDHSLVHFDLKPANIFLKGDVARVGDYGLSKLVSASRNSLSFGRGTPYYMAPE